MGLERKACFLVKAGCAIFPSMSETCKLYAVLMMVLPLLFVASVGHRSRDKGFAWCIMTGAILYEVFSFTVPLVLGNVQALTVDYYRRAMWACGGAVGLVALMRLPALVRSLLAIRYRPRWEDIPLGIGLLLVWRIIRHDHQANWVFGPGQFDAMSYHIPRALQWIWSGGMEPYRTSIWQQVGLAYGGSAAVVSPVLYGCGFLGSAFNTFVYTIGASASLFVIARALGLSARASLAATLAFLSCPAIGLRFADVNTDITAAFPVMAATAFFLTRDSLSQGAFRFFALVGMGTACKQYVAFPAVPIGLTLFWPHLRELRSLRSIGSVSLGILCGLSACALSFYPIYRGFGDLTGGGVAHDLSTIRGGWSAVIETLEFTLVGWLFEPLGLVPVTPRAEIFQSFHIAQLFKYVGIDVGPGGPSFDNEHNRSCVLSPIFLPWLLLAVQRGRRMYVLCGFLIICLAQFSLLAVNHVGARFAIIPLAAFSLLWGARAARNGFVVSSFVLFALWVDFRYLVDWHKWEDAYRPEAEMNKPLAERVRGDTVLLLSSGLSVDAFVAGRQGQVRYTYVNCPLDGDWVKMLRDLAQRYRWFLLPTTQERFVPGPVFESRLGGECEPLTVGEIRTRLAQAGWRFDRLDLQRLELWTTEVPNPSAGTLPPAPNG